MNLAYPTNMVAAEDVSKGKPGEDSAESREGGLVQKYVWG